MFQISPIYLWKKVLVESDHKPLENIFKKPINQCPARVQRIRLGTQKYDIEVKYKPGKELLIADALSRAYLKDDKHDFETDMEEQVCSLLETFPISIEKKELFQEETAKDEELQMLGRYINVGWPNQKSLRSGPDILAGRFVFANSDRGEISHHHLTIVDLSVGVAWPSQGMVG